MGNEKSTDQFVREMLRGIGFGRPWEQSCSDAPSYVYDALEGASKSLGGGRGKPEFLVESGPFLVLIEDKADLDRSRLLIDGKIDISYPARAEYALNGAAHYAKHIADRTGKGVFAVGVAGAETHHEVTVAFAESGSAPRLLAKVDALTDLAEEHIDEYHRVAVLGQLPREEREAREIRKVAAGLHEDMRNYASLEGERKATLVSAILLALKYQPDLIDDLKGEKKSGFTDGEKVYKAAREYLESDEADLKPKQKIGALLDQFAFIKTHVLLNKPNKDLGNITPMKRFTQVLDHDVLHAVSNPSRTAFDVLGNFYGEFVKYGG
ncbi:adenine methyltransferase, partial [Dietzia sp. UCD-THP]